MNAIKNRMINNACERFDRIYPVSARGSLDDCFTVEENMIIFWFNTEDQTTHTVIEQF